MIKNNFFEFEDWECIDDFVLQGYNVKTLKDFLSFKAGDILPIVYLNFEENEFSVFGSMEDENPVCIVKFDISLENINQI